MGSVLANAGIDLYTVGKQLGHAQAKTTAPLCSFVGAGAAKCDG
jgi:hypothetical protein